jgi:peroxiredoxin
METLASPIGRYAPDFELPAVDGTVHHLARYLEQHQAVVVVFICNHCPYVAMYLDRLKQLQHEFAGQGVQLIGINPNDADQYPSDSFDNMKLFAQQHDLNFLYLRDVTQDVAHSFGALKTPHAFLLNQQGIICYAGAIDDNAEAADSVQQTYLRQAIAQLLAGRSHQLPLTDPVGCSVKWRR